MWKFETESGLVTQFAFFLLRFIFNMWWLWDPDRYPQEPLKLSEYPSAIAAVTLPYYLFGCTELLVRGICVVWVCIRVTRSETHLPVQDFHGEEIDLQIVDGKDPRKFWSRIAQCATAAVALLTLGTFTGLVSKQLLDNAWPGGLDALNAQMIIMLIPSGITFLLSIGFLAAGCFAVFIGYLICCPSTRLATTNLGTWARTERRISALQLRND
jgi:hypothetical protein